MIVAVLRTRLIPEERDEYMPWSDRMNALVATIPGYISHKRFDAPDGERLLFAEFESMEAVRAWSVHPEHVEAKKKGRASFYQEYRVQICSVLRDSAFPKEAT